MESMLKLIFLAYHQKRVDECQEMDQDPTLTSAEIKSPAAADGDLNAERQPPPTETVQLECASEAAPLIKFEKRGVKLGLFQRVRDECLKRDACTSGHWTIGRVGALVVGNHEILVTDEKDAKEAAAIAEGKTSDSVYRWGKHVDPSSTLTHAGKCSLIESIRQGRFEASDALLGGGLRYDQVVGAKADIFVSFAYSCDFVELVDALECFFERTPSLDKNITYLWFDLFVNDQWTALDKPFEWWATTFKEAVEEIGHTVVVMLPWEAPIPLTRVWCLFEIACSKNLSIALSSTQLATFNNTLRTRFEAIMAALCKIDVQLATSYLPEDKEKIFAVVEASERGFHGLNVDVSSKMREWIESSARKLTLNVEGNDAPLVSSMQHGILLIEQGRFVEAEEVLRRALREVEAEHGFEHLVTAMVATNLGVALDQQNKLDEAEKLLKHALKFYEQQGDKIEAHYCLDVLLNIGGIHMKQGKTSEAEAAWLKAKQGFEVAEGFGSGHTSTLRAQTNLGGLYKEVGKLHEAETMLASALAGNEVALGPQHPGTLLTAMNLAVVYKGLGKYTLAENTYKRTLFGYEKVYGILHPSTLQVCGNLGNLLLQLNRLEEAENLLTRALRGEEQVFGQDNPNALLTAMNLSAVICQLGRVDEAQKLLSKAHSGLERLYGPSHPHTKMAAENLMRLGVFREGKGGNGSGSDNLGSKTSPAPPSPPSAPQPRLLASQYAAMSIKELKAEIVAARLGHRLAGLSEKRELVALLVQQQ